MRSTTWCTLLLAALAGPAARADGGPAPPAVPLAEVPGAAVDHAEPRERVARLLDRIGRRFRPLRGLVPPTQGQLRLAVVLVELADAPRPPWGPAAFEAALLSRGTYRRTATGEPAAGSMHDYFRENSSGALDLVGEVFDWVPIEARRADLDRRVLLDPLARRALFRAALDGLVAREGAGALDGFDALAFVVSGDQATRRGGVLWPHSSVTTHRGRAWRYYLMHAGARRFQAIGVHCHEMGHVLGILDKYGVGAGTGLGQWCLMAQGGHGARQRGVPRDAPPTTFADTLRRVANEKLRDLRDLLGQGGRAPGEAGAAALGDARPLHLCAVCKVRLGWSPARVIDPRRPARFFLTPVEEDASQVARILLDPRGRETLVLEHRGQRGFDAGLPAAGLLVWRVGSPSALARTFVPFERVELVPAHGVRSIDAPLRAPASVPFPADRDAVTVRGTLPGSWAVRLEQIRLEDGRLSLTARVER